MIWFQKYISEFLFMCSYHMVIFSNAYSPKFLYPFLMYLNISIASVGLRVAGNKIDFSNPYLKFWIMVMEFEKLNEK